MKNIALNVTLYYIMHSYAADGDKELSLRCLAFCNASPRE